MDKYSKTTDTSLLADYAQFIDKLGKFERDFDNWKSKDINAEETKYYVEVEARISKKLIDASLK